MHLPVLSASAALTITPAPPPPLPSLPSLDALPTLPAGLTGGVATSLSAAAAAMSAGLTALLPPLAVLTILSATRLILTTLRRGSSGGGRAGGAGGRGSDGGGGGGGRGAAAPTLAQRLAYARTAARLMRVDREFTPADYEALLELDAFGGAVPRGATKEVVESLPVKVLGDDEEGPAAASTSWDSGGGSSSSSPASSGSGSSSAGSSRRPLGGEVCTVCLDVMSRGDRVMVLDCGHGMHRSCGARWLDVRAVCPVCKGGVGDNSRKRD